MKKFDHDKNVMGYPYPSQPPNPGYTLPHQGYMNQSHENRPQNFHQQTISSYPNYPHHQHPSYPIPTHGYPPTMTPENPKGYSNVASFAYYKTKVYQPLELEQVETRSNFVRFLTLLSIILVGALCAMTLVVWLIFGTQLPDFYVTSFTMPCFNITGSEFIAKWEANVSIKNLNDNLEVYFSKGKSSIFYENKVLALGYVEPFHLSDKEKNYLQTNMTTTEEDQFAEETLSHLAEQRKNGSIIFSLRMAVGAKFQSNNWWRKEKLKIFCEDLNVKFNDTTGIGTLTGEDPHVCLIFT